MNEESAAVTAFVDEAQTREQVAELGEEKRRVYMCSVISAINAATGCVLFIMSFNRWARSNGAYALFALAGMLLVMTSIYAIKRDVEGLQQRQRDAAEQRQRDAAAAVRYDESVA